MTKRPPAPPAPKAPASLKSPRATIPSAIPLNVITGPVAGPDRILIYGTGGIGKSTLAAYLPAPLFLDVERSTNKINVTRATPMSWAELRGNLASIEADPPEGYRSIVIDSATIAEEFAKEHVIEWRKTDKGKRVDSIDGFGWGKGWQFVYDEYTGLLADLDRIAAKGLHVCLIAHEVASPAPNPGSEAFLRWEPALYGGDKKERGSIRRLLKNWADHVLFIGYDVFVEDGKGQGSGTRTIYTQELPEHIAKSRTKQTQLSFEISNPGAVWAELGIS